MAHLVVIGPGALGTLFAVRLIEAGHQVTMACRTAATAKQVRRDGLHLVDDAGRHETACNVVSSPKDVAGIDGIIVATKCATAAKVVTLWRSVAGDAPIICLQNGLMGDELAAVAGSNFVPCTVGFPASWDGPGRSTQTGYGALHIGTWPSGPSRPELAHVATWLASVAPVFESENMHGVAWSKLLINSVGTVSVLTGHAMGDLLRLPRAKAAFLAIVAEGYAAGLAAGVQFEKVAGFHPAMLDRVGRMGGRRLQFLVLSLIGRKYRRMKSSSLQSLERGQKTEVDWLNGQIVATAAAHNVPSPVNTALVGLIKSLERGEQKPGVELLDALPL